MHHVLHILDVPANEVACFGQFTILHHDFAFISWALECTWQRISPGHAVPPMQTAASRRTLPPRFWWATYTCCEQKCIRSSLWPLMIVSFGRESNERLVNYNTWWPLRFWRSATINTQTVQAESFWWVLCRVLYKGYNKYSETCASGRRLSVEMKSHCIVLSWSLGLSWAAKKRMAPGRHVAGKLLLTFQDAYSTGSQRFFSKWGHPLCKKAETQVPKTKSCLNSQYFCNFNLKLFLFIVCLTVSQYY